MSGREEYENGLYRITEYFAFVLGAIGVALMFAAGAWWVYQSIQRGMTPSEMGELGASLAFVAVFVKVGLEVFTMDGDDEEQPLNRMFRDD